MKAILTCAKPYPEQPKTGIMFGKCELCAGNIIYDPLNLERVKQIHGENGVQIVCMECTETVMREEPFVWGGVFVQGKQYIDESEGTAAAEANRRAHGGTK